MSSDHNNGELTIKKMSIEIDADNQDRANMHYVVVNNGTNSYDTVNISITFISADGKKIKCSEYPVKNLVAGGSVEVNDDAFIQIIGSADYEFSYK